MAMWCRYWPQRLLGLCVLLTCSCWFSQASGLPSQFDYNFEDQRFGTLKPEFLTPAVRPIINLQNGQIVPDPDDSNNRVLRVLHPAGAVGPGEGSGIRFDVDLEPADRYWFSYQVQFQDDFVWRTGGKLPGLMGGDAATGGQVADGDGWSVRQMWFDSGKFSPYLYHMDQPGVFGDTLGGTGSFGQDSRFTPGQWHHVAGFVRLNTDNNLDGEYKLFLDGLLIKDRDDLRFRNEGQAPIDVFTVTTFFGGQSDDYRPVKDEYIFFDELRVSTDVDFVFETLAGGTPDSALNLVPGDFNRDGVVNIADYAAWRDGLGSIYTAAAYNVWKSNFGVSSSGMSSALLGSQLAVPEPGGIGLVLLGAGMMVVVRRGAR